MLHAGLDLSRRKVDVCLLSSRCEIVDEWASPNVRVGVTEPKFRLRAMRVPMRRASHSSAALVKSGDTLYRFRTPYQTSIRRIILSVTSPEPRDESGENKAPGPVWTRLPGEKPQRPTRQAIVAAAIQLADTEGLDAVSIRRVAAALGTRPMGLYSHIARKDDLIDLMADEVLAEALLDEVPGDWREALSALAHALRAACLTHPWLVTAAWQRPGEGPNGMRLFEQSLQAIAELDVERTTKLAIVRAVTAYAMGHTQLGLARGEGRARLRDPEWRTTAQAYLQRLADSGDYPHLAALGAEDLLPNENEAPGFDTGLDWLLTGIAAEVSATSD